MDNKLLNGVRVLDMTNVLAGPYCTYQLALLGADVIKIETPRSGDLARQLGDDEILSQQMLGASFLAQNANKRSLTIDLKNPLSRDIVERLTKTADVLVENFRPGVMERLGLPWKTVRQINDGLIYCSLSGFGQSGTMSKRPAYDQIIQGLSGMMSVTGSVEFTPLRVGFPVCDTLAGLQAASAITAALVGRQLSGTGCYIDISMLEVSIAALGWVLSDYLISGHIPTPMGNENNTSAPSGTFDASDGKLNIAANRQQQFELLCKTIGREELVDDFRFRTRESRKRHRSELRDELNQTLQTRPASEWEEVLNAVGVPAGQILSVPEVVQLPQLKERGFFADVPLPGDNVGSVRVVGNGVHIDGKACRPSHSPPLLGEDTDAILEELGFDFEEVAHMREMRAI